jgi:predicted DNA-binding protein
MEQVTTRIPKKVRDDLKEVAKKRGTTMVQFIRDAIAAFLRGEWK